MALTRKGSRVITVGDKKYRWVVTPYSDHVVVVIWGNEGVGRIAKVKVFTDIDRLWVEFPHIEGMNLRVVKPADVRSMILQALAQGWKPLEKGAAMDFDLNSDGILHRRKPPPALKTPG